MGVAEFDQGGAGGVFHDPPLDGYGSDLAVFAVVYACGEHGGFLSLVCAGVGWLSWGLLRAQRRTSRPSGQLDVLGEGQRLAENT